VHRTSGARLVRLFTPSPWGFGGTIIRQLPPGAAIALNADSYGYAYPNIMHISSSPTPSTMGLSNVFFHVHEKLKPSPGWITTGG
jgi:hypothetical protein